MAPVNALVAFVAVSYTPTMYRSPPRAQIRTAFRLGLLLAGSALVSGIAFMVMPQAVGYFALGESWASSRDVLPWTAIGYAAVGATSVGLTVLTVRGQSGAILAVEGLGASLTLVLGTIAAALLGTVTGVVLWTSLSAYLPLLLCAAMTASIRVGGPDRA